MTAAGHAASGSEWLDLHFEANRSEYEAALHAVGIEPNSHVLDAACGAGNYLPWIACLVGPAGRITALDLAPENIATVRQRLEQDWSLDAPVEAVEGSVLNLPFADDTFDAIWFANTSQYLSDEDLKTTFEEFHRITKPGGLVAIKDMDVTTWSVSPGPPDIFWRYLECRWRVEEWTQPKGLANRIWTMNRWLERAGFEDVWQEMRPVEWRPSLSDVRHAYLREMFSSFATAIIPMINDGTIEAPADVHDFWQIVADPDHPDHPANSDDFYYREGQYIVVGRVPL